MFVLGSTDLRTFQSAQFLTAVKSAMSSQRVQDIMQDLGVLAKRTYPEFVDKLTGLHFLRTVLPVLFYYSAFRVRVEGRDFELCPGITVEALEQDAVVWWNEQTRQIRLPYLFVRVLLPDLVSAQLFLRSSIITGTHDSIAPSGLELLAVEMLSLRMRVQQIQHPETKEMKLSNLLPGFPSGPLDALTVPVPVGDMHSVYEVQRTVVQVTDANWSTVPDGFLLFAKSSAFPDGAYKWQCNEAAPIVLVQVKQRQSSKIAATEGKARRQERLMSEQRTIGGHRARKKKIPTFSVKDVLDEYNKTSPASNKWKAPLVFVMVSEGQFTGPQYLWKADNNRDFIVVYDWSSGENYFGRLINTLKLLRPVE